MVRGNSITEAGTAGYEPYSEVMASLIAQVLGLPDYNAWEIVKRTNACLMEAPYWLRFSEDETFEDTTCGRARRIMNTGHVKRNLIHHEEDEHGNVEKIL